MNRKTPGRRAEVFNLREEYEKQMRAQILDDTYHFPFAELAKATPLQVLQLLEDTDHAAASSVMEEECAIARLYRDMF